MFAGYKIRRRTDIIRGFEIIKSIKVLKREM